tara:strand:- start:56 stop:466 length:411 start_codon:yes stop_codon:yes gene_type:complete
MDDKHIISILQPETFEKVSVAIVAVLLAVLCIIPLMVSGSIALKIMFSFFILLLATLLVGTLSFKKVTSYDKDNKRVLFTRSALIMLSQEEMQISETANIYLVSRQAKLKQQIIDFSPLELSSEGRVITVRNGSMV